MSPLESLGQIAEKAAVESQISFHNIAMHIARARLGRAERISEHMEHKIELYDSLHVIGRLALEGPNPSTEEPETLVERVTEWKIDRRAAKQNRAYLINHQSEKIYGRARNELPKSIGQTVFEALTTDDNVPGSDVHSSIIGNTVAFFTGPDVKGKTNLSKKISRTRNNIQFITGKKRAAERREQKQEINSTVPKHGNKSHRISRRGARRANESYERAATMPLSSSWRASRLERADARQVRMEEIIIHHRERLEELRN